MINQAADTLPKDSMSTFAVGKYVSVCIQVDYYIYVCNPAYICFLLLEGINAIRSFSKENPKTQIKVIAYHLY